jgi:hypothetical protein
MSGDAEHIRRSVMNRAARFALAISLAPLSLCSPASAQQVEYGTTLICDTQEQVERYIALFNGEAQTTVNQLNAEEHNPYACSLGTVTYLRGPEIKTTRTPTRAYHIFRILVVGVETPSGIQRVQPASFFTLFENREYAV